MFAGHTECYKLVEQWQKATRTVCSWLEWTWSLPFPIFNPVLPPTSCAVL